jgi:hypothetical protein
MSVNQASITATIDKLSLNPFIMAFPVFISHSEREDFVKGLCQGVFAQANSTPGNHFNVMVCKAEWADASKLNGIVYDGAALFPAGLFDPIIFRVLVFSTGVFVNTGDGGFINWCFEGSFVKDGNTVTFS